MEPRLRTLEADEFVRRLLDRSTQPEAKFAFFLGAGCSVSSGIPSAATLVKDHWLPKLRDLRAPHRKDIAAWAKQEFPDYDETNPALSYGPVLEERFNSTSERQRETETLCTDKKPGLGYAVLAQLMESEHGVFNVALTTNFDDLLADAFLLFSKTRPLVIPHKTLGGYIRLNRTRPIVIKLHGDHQLSPLHTTEETNALGETILKPVRNLLQDRSLIFFGYGGNDESIRHLLEPVSEQLQEHVVYWVAGKEPVGAIRPWLDSVGAIWIQNRDFDKLMVRARDVFGLEHPNPRRFYDILANYSKTYSTHSAEIKRSLDSTPNAAASETAARRTDEPVPDWWLVEVSAQSARHTEPERIDEIYALGIQQFPSSAPLLGNYAIFLTDVRHDHDQAEIFYQRAIVADPTLANNLGNYAIFLNDVRQDRDQAERFYRRALAANPSDAAILGNYANFLKSACRDYDQADSFYLQSLDIDPTDAVNLGNYAIFLADVRHDYDQAETLYQRAVEFDSSDANILTNYALFLTKIRRDHDRAETTFIHALRANETHAGNLGNYAAFLTNVRFDFDKAEAFFLRALQSSPNEAGILGNYAAFLTNVRRDHDRAEVFFERALRSDASDAGILSNYALFLTNIRLDHDRAEALYRRALESIPTHANSLGNYAVFMSNVRRRPDQAETLYERALDANPTSAETLGNFANFLAEIRGDLERAESLFQQALAVDSTHANNLGNYATVLTTLRRDHDRAEELYQRALDADPNDAHILNNYAIFLKNIRHDYDRAETFYRRAFDADPNNGGIINNYANFLTDIRHDHDQAERFFARALNAHPTDANILGSYANFLRNARHDKDRAKILYQRALKADPRHANNFPNYAGFLLAWSLTDEGLRALDTALNNAAVSNASGPAAECWFYAFAHRPPDLRRAALRELKRVLIAGARSPGWNLAPAIDRAREDGHPSIEWLVELAAVIADGADIAILDNWPEWSSA